MNSFFHRAGAGDRSEPLRKHFMRRVFLGLVLLVLAGGIAFLFRANTVLQKISSGKGNLFENILKSVPGSTAKLDGEDAGRINIALLAMRGKDDPAGGLLSDTIMVLSIHPSQKDGDAPKASLVSIPRDLYVTVPGTSDRQKINAVYAYGEARGSGQGMENMKKILTDVTGQPIQYAFAVNYQGFLDIVNMVGGVTVHLDQPFSEGTQFHQPQVCDPYVYTVPAYDSKTKLRLMEDKYQTTSTGGKRLTRQYPMCYNKDEECGGVFSLSVGDTHLDGKNALCFARARDETSDFDRAKRQQEILKLVEAKLLSAGTLTDFGKIQSLMTTLGENLRTDMQGWELKRAFDLYQKLGTAGQKLAQQVLDDSDTGLLYTPPETKETGFILLPKGDNYDRIHALFASLP